uniref:Uncharacterized protein n=1 Tax=Babesia bovis TaxID=5865 RepID=S6AZC7_BABBO|nr:hypothetical protein [Babesia bovis]
MVTMAVDSVDANQSYHVPGYYQYCIDMGSATVTHSIWRGTSRMMEAKRGIIV